MSIHINISHFTGGNNKRPKNDLKNVIYQGYSKEIIHKIHGGNVGCN